MAKVSIKGVRSITALWIGLALLLAASPVRSAGFDPHTSFSGSNFTSAYAGVPEAKTVWSSPMDLQTDDYTMGRGSAAAGGGKIYLLQQGQLKAINVLTGKTVWKYGAKLIPPLLYQDGVIYTSSQAGTIYAVNALTGKNKWSSSLPSQAVTQLIADQNQLIAANGDIQAFNLKDGKFQWKEDYSYPLNQPVAVLDGLILTVEWVSGAYSYDLLHAFDRVTGKQLWDAANHSLPIAAGNGTVLSQRTSNMLQAVPLTTLDTLDAKSGKVRKTAEYNPDHIDTSVEGTGYAGKAWISGSQLYIDNGPTVHSYPADADPSKAAKLTYSVAASGQSFRYAAGPYDGRVLFCDGDSIYGIKTANNSLVTYYGGGGIARFDLLGHGIYIASADGQLLAMSLLTGRAVLQLPTTGRVFGPTLLESGMIIVQSKGRLTAFKEPSVLKIN